MWPLKRPYKSISLSFSLRCEFISQNNISLYQLIIKALSE